MRWSVNSAITQNYGPPLQLAGRGVTIPIRTHVSSFSQTCISCPATFLFESYLERNEEYRRTSKRRAIYFLLSRPLVNTRVKLYIYIPHARFPLSFLYREERFSRRCGLIGGLRPLSPLPFLIYEAECCRVTNAEYRLNFKTKFRRVGGMVNSRDGASVVPNNYMRLYR